MSTAGMIKSENVAEMSFFREKIDIYIKFPFVLKE